MPNKRVIKEILNVKYIAIDSLDIIDKDIHIHVHPTKGKQCRCGLCGKKSRPYDAGRGTRSWRAGDWNTHRVYLHAEAPRVQCKEHGVVVAQFPWARHRSNFTYDFEQAVAWLAIECSKKAVAHLMRISWNSVGPIISRVKEALDPSPEKRFDNLKRIGIDETSYKKGHKYITVVVDHDTGKVIWVAKGHGKTVLKAFFQSLTNEQRAKIELVSADGARWISDCIADYCPNAERCIDPFHVVTWAMEALDQVRREAWHDAKTKQPGTKRKRGRPAKDAPPKDTTVSDIKGSRYALGKAPENLTVKQQAKVEMIAKSDNRLYRGYLLKENLRLLFKMDEHSLKTELDRWIGWARRCRIPVFVELQRKICRHYDAIVATIKHHLSNARIEAINNKIKLSIRMAYGFRNIENMLDMIMLRCSSIEVLLPWQVNCS